VWLWLVEAQSVDKLVSSISHLYSELNVEQYQLERERQLQTQLTELHRQIEPLEQVRRPILSLSLTCRASPFPAYCKLPYVAR